MRAGARPFILILFLLCLTAPAARAHESRPLYIDIAETGESVFLMQWKTPLTVPPQNTPDILGPGSCVPLGPLSEIQGSDGVIRRQSISCPGGFSKEPIRIRYPRQNPSLSTLVRLHRLDGQKSTAVLGPEETEWLAPEKESMLSVALDYTLLGVKHIWAGIDHLLFLLCLLWIAGTLRRVLITISGFTLAHSVTLILSALDIVHVPVPPVEATIALSIVFLATEIVKNQRQSLTWRHPIAVSSSFGLLHGFGFAAVLNQIGLPQTELVTGLLFFNVGVEIGQVIFVAGAGAVILLLRGMNSRLKLCHEHGGGFQQIVGYGIGAVTAFWLIQRCAAFLPNL